MPTIERAKRKRLNAVLGATMILLTTAGAAKAELVTIRVTGAIDYMNHGFFINPFGVPGTGGSLATPVAYVYELTFDTGVGTYTVDQYNNTLHGIPQTNPANRSWSLTINGITDKGTFDSGELYNSGVTRSGSSAAGTWSLGFDGGYNPLEYHAATINVYSAAANSPTFSDPFVNQNTSGIATFHHYGTDQGPYYQYTLTGSVTGLEVLQDQIAAVPEPATWAMMLLGFLGIGGLVRARRSRFAASAG